MLGTDFRFSEIATSALNHQASYQVPEVEFEGLRWVLLVSGSHSQFGSKALSLGRQLKGKADRVNRSPIVLRDRESSVGSLNWLTGILDEVAGNQHFQLGHQSALCFRDKRLTSYHFLKGQAEFL